MARRTDIIDLRKLKPRTQQSVEIVDSSFILTDDYVSPIRDIWNRFDRIICIHFLPYTERFENIKRELKRVGILDLPQFEWYFTIDNDFYKYVLDGIPKDKINRNRVSLSNIKYTIDSFTLLKKLKFHGYGHVLIIEDDIVFHKDLNFIREVVNSTPEVYDVMNYDPDVIQTSNGVVEKVGKHVQRYSGNKMVVNMSCCAVSRRIISHIIDKQLKFLQPFDIYTWMEADGFDTYCVSKKSNICIQDMISYSNRQSERTINEKYSVQDLDNYLSETVNFAKHDFNVIVSLTSYPHRFTQPGFIDCLKSLVNQETTAKYKVVLNLFKDDIPLLPSDVKGFIDRNGIELISCDKDIKQHKKYFYVMRKYRNTPIITVDDDVIYQPYLVGSLYWTYMKNRDYVVCGRCDRMTRDESGGIQNMDKWEEMVSIPNCKDKDLFGIGIGGILYSSIVNRVIDDKFVELIERVKSDDCLMFIVARTLGLKYMTVDTNKPYHRTGGMGFLGKEPLPFGRDEKALWIVNKKCNYKDRYIKYFEQFNDVDSFLQTIRGENMNSEMDEFDYQFDHGYGCVQDMVSQFIGGLSGRENSEQLMSMIDEAIQEIHQCVPERPPECIRDEIINALPKELYEKIK